LYINHPRDDIDISHRCTSTTLMGPGWLNELGSWIT
jgi:hypothetical protein